MMSNKMPLQSPIGSLSSSSRKNSYRNSSHATKHTTPHVFIKEASPYCCITKKETSVLPFG